LSSSAKTRIDAAGSLRRGRVCPSARHLAEAFAEGAGIAEKRRVLDHVAVCPDCAREFRVLVELWRHRSEIPVELSVPDVRTLARHQIAGLRAGRRDRVLWGLLPGRRILSLAAGAALLFFCVMTYSVWKDRRPIDADRVVFSGGVALLSPKSGEVLKPSFLFRWSAVEDAADYTLEVLDTALLPVLTYPHLSETRCEPPAEDIGRLEAGRTYFWKVTADLGDLRRVESRIERFKVPD